MSEDRCFQQEASEAVLMPWPGTSEGRPLWGRAGYTTLHIARLSSVPSGDRSANPASVPGCSGLQLVHLSVSSARKRSGAERLAAPLGVSRAARAAVPCRSSTSGHRASSSKYTRGQSRETRSLSRLFGSVETPPNVSRWVMHTVEQSYRSAPPPLPPFNWIIPTLVGPSSRQRVRILQPYFIVSGKDGGCVLF